MYSTYAYVNVKSLPVGNLWSATEDSFEALAGGRTTEEFLKRTLRVSNEEKAYLRVN
jgi:hypothetical protein